MYSYSIILLASIFFPLILSFEGKVRYVRRWKRILIASAIVAVPYLVWDAIFTANGIWGFNESFTLGINIFHLPVEEILFFIAIPFSLFIFWEIDKKYKLYKFFSNYRFFYAVTQAIAVLMLIFYYEKTYTLVVMLATLVATKLVNKRKSRFKRRLLFVFFVSIIPFFIVNGLLTSLPVVWYNVTAKSNIMIWTIPLEDLFYSYSLLAFNAIAYVRVRKMLKNRKKM